MSSSSPTCESIHEYITPTTLVQQSSQWYPENYKSIIIMNPASSKVLDGTQYETKLREYTGSPLQLWSFEFVGNGNFLLKNVGNERFLQVLGKVKNGALVTTDNRNGGSSQQWRYSPQDQTISNPASTKVLDIRGWDFAVGHMMIFNKHAGTNQRFSFHYK